MSVFWLVLFIVLLLIEIFTVNLVSVWFAIGAAVAMISSFFVEGIIFQVIVFVGISVISLILTKKFVNKFKKADMIPTNLDRVIGKKGEVILEISPNKIGQVKVMGTIWSAVSSCKIQVGEKVVVDKIDGVKLIVMKEEK